jgi:DNA-binding CsgD family transcriptional regulator
MARILVLTDSRLVADWITLALGRWQGSGLALCVVNPHRTTTPGVDRGADLAIVDLTAAAAGLALEVLLADRRCPQILAILGPENGVDGAGLIHPRVRSLPRSTSLRSFACAVQGALPWMGRGSLDGRAPGSNRPRARAAGAQAEGDVRRALTERELEVLGLLGAGSTNKAIAEALGVAVPTVKNHVSCILRKLGVRNRRELGVAEVLLL